MTYADLYRILTEAEARVRETKDAQIRANSQETVALCLERVRRDGITREQLKRGY